LLKQPDKQEPAKWWAHFEFTPVNITPTIRRKKIEEIPDRLGKKRCRVISEMMAIRLEAGSYT